MQKVKNVINLLIIFITLIFLSQATYSQKKIVGKYSFLAPFQEHYDFFSFENNGIFEYHEGASLGDNIFGKGQYHLKGDSLILSYNLTELEYRSYHKVKKYYNSKDSIKVKVIVQDFKGNPNINANVYNFKDRIGGVVDNNGIIILKFKKDEKDFILDVSNLGYEGYKLKLSNLENYIIEVFLSDVPNISKAINEEVVKYKVLELSKEILKLKTTKNKIITLRKVK